MAHMLSKKKNATTSCAIAAKLSLTGENLESGKLKPKGNVMKKYVICMAVVSLIGVLGCQEKGAGEKAGERIDEVIDNVKHGDAPLKEKGALEKMGESIDDSMKQGNKK